ncbi:MAG: 16S rRNA (adenine(1518)-N(6)/adenine(1519)-N(6))-dimethyltransferase RsmA [Candidatus Paceibacterota bacterium]
MEYDLFDPSQIELLLSSHGLKPAKRFGQNFIMDPEAVGAIIASAQITKKDTVLEIGPGLGTLTGALCKTAKNVLAIEKDPNMVGILRKTCAKFKNLQIIHADALKFDWATIKSPYKIASNLPYNVASHLIRQILESSNRPQLMALMVQKEVGERIVAQAPDANILGLSVQIYANASLELIVPSTAFYPEPKVDSAIVRIEPKNDAPSAQKTADIFRLIKIGFSSPRKKLSNNLSTGLNRPKNEIEALMAKENIDLLSRPENLSLHDWEVLIKHLG